MNRQNSSSLPSTYPALSIDACEFELHAAQAHLQTNLSDLIYLLGQILDRDIPRAQLQHLLEDACLRLQSLRISNTELRKKISDVDLGAAIGQAGNALAGGGSMSLQAADHAYEQAYRQCTGDQQPIAVLIRGEQAQLAAVGLNFRHAAALYAEAASLCVDEKWQYLAQQAAALAELGREFIDIEALQASIDLYENEILPLIDETSRSADWAKMQYELGSTLGILGQRHRGTHLLDKAITAFENALTHRQREQSPQQWAAIQNGFGNALGSLAQRHHDEYLLERAIATFESALEVRTIEQSREDWATTQNNLAALLMVQGQQKKDRKLLKRAVDTYKAMLTVWVREQKPLLWAATMNNLGNALRLLGEHRKGPRTLEQAVAAYNAALSVRTRERVPYDWAMTQNNLGAAHQALGERVDDPIPLGRAVAAYKEATREWTREKEPMTWAMTLANLGVARYKLARRNRDIDSSRQASVELKMAVDVFRAASHAQLTELGGEQLSLSRKLTSALETEHQE